MASDAIDICAVLDQLRYHLSGVGDGATTQTALEQPFHASFAPTRNRHTVASGHYRHVVCAASVPDCLGPFAVESWRIRHCGSGLVPGRAWLGELAGVVVWLRWWGGV
jgi:hypothetical protein